MDIQTYIEEMEILGISNYINYASLEQANGYEDTIYFLAKMKNKYGVDPEESLRIAESYHFDLDETIDEQDVLFWQEIASTNADYLSAVEKSPYRILSDTLMKGRNPNSEFSDVSRKLSTETEQTAFYPVKGVTVLADQLISFIDKPSSGITGGFRYKGRAAIGNIHLSHKSEGQDSLVLELACLPRLWKRGSPLRKKLSIDISELESELKNMDSAAELEGSKNIVLKHLFHVLQYVEKKYPRDASQFRVCIANEMGGNGLETLLKLKKLSQQEASDSLENSVPPRKPNKVDRHAAPNKQTLSRFDHFINDTEATHPALRNMTLDHFMRFNEKLWVPISFIDPFLRHSLMSRANDQAERDVRSPTGYLSLEEVLLLTGKTRSDEDTVRDAVDTITHLSSMWDRYEMPALHAAAPALTSSKLNRYTARVHPIPNALNLPLLLSNSGKTNLLTINEESTTDEDTGVASQRKKSP